MWSNHVLQQKRKQFKEVVSTDKTDTIYEIPVVIHYLHTGSDDLTDAQIKAWLESGNDYFTGSSVRSKSGTTPLPCKLVLAKTDESCEATSAIIRYDMSY